MPPLAPSIPLDKIAVQLYTIRDTLEKDAVQALEKLARIGFTQVETAFWPANLPIEAAGQLLKSLGLSVSAAHIQLPLNAIEIQKLQDTCGCNRFIWHGWPEDAGYASLEGTRKLIKAYNEYAQVAREVGCRFGLHNHWWEFRNKVDGKAIFEWLLEETDPDIFFELDVYWVQFAGQKPDELIPRFGNRLEMLHLKDGPALFRPSISLENMDNMTALGQGALNLAAIIEQAKPLNPIYVIEMDQTEGDVFIALENSFNYLHTR